MTDTLGWHAPTFLREVEKRSATAVSACYQCHKCSTGCPVGGEMALLPSQVMRLIHFGAEREVLRSEGIWLCASCETCVLRCPMGIDTPKVMDTLRMMAVERKVGLPDGRSEKFNRSFLGSVRRHGRVYEMGMLVAYKLRGLGRTARAKARGSGRTGYSDGLLALKMLAKKKLSLLPSRSGAASRVKEIFKRAKEDVAAAPRGGRRMWDVEEKKR